MEGSSTALQSAPARIQDYEYLYASNTNVSDFVSVKLSSNGNYIFWKAQMLCLLDSIGMRGIVDATFVRSGDCGMETMRKYNSLVKGWIFGSVSEDVLVDIYNLDSVKAVWEKLKSIYEPAMCMQEDSTRKRSDTKADLEDRDANIAKTHTTKECAKLMEITVLEETETKHEYTQTIQNKIKHKNHINEILQYKKFREVIRHGDWSSLNQRILNEPINDDGSTILHLAVGMHVNDILKTLFLLVNEEYLLKKRDSDGSTALHVAAIVGNTYAAKLLVQKSRTLLRVVDHDGEEPLHKAYQNMHLDTIVYLLHAMKHYAMTELESSLVGSVRPGVEIVVDILVNAISAKQYSLALDLIQTFPNSASQSDDVLMAIAKTFPKGLDNGENFFYPFLSNFVETMKIEASRFVMQCCFLPRMVYDTCAILKRNPRRLIVELLILVVCLTVPFMIMASKTLVKILMLIVGSPFHVFYFLLWKCAKLLGGPIKHIESRKKELDEAGKVLQLVCVEIDKLNYTGIHHPYYTRPILKAACHNAHKVVDEILSRAPGAIQSTDNNGYDIIQLAIIHRSEKVFNLIYEIGERKNLYRTIEDSSKNNILHLVGKLAPSSVLNRRTGAALQLQRELQWREEVKKLVFPTYITKENMFNETPDMVFTREHKDLVKEGEKWMKTVAESCSITAALITTVVFAAAITVPGGSNQENGTPLFRKEGAFIVFAISDALSLFTSTTALLVFLSILTTRFAEDDFLISLPRRLLIGLFSLLVSTTAMMIAFSSTLFLVFCDRKLWMLAPICGLAFIPVAFFVTLQLPLMVDLSMSTYFPIFGIKKVSIVKGYDTDNMLLLCG